MLIHAGIRRERSHNQIIQDVNEHSGEGCWLEAFLHFLLSLLFFFFSSFFFCVGVNDAGTGVVCRVCDFNNIELCSLILVP